MTTCSYYPGRRTGDVNYFVLLVLFEMGMGGRMLTVWVAIGPMTMLNSSSTHLFVSIRRRGERRMRVRMRIRTVNALYMYMLSGTRTDGTVFLEEAFEGGATGSACK